MRREVRVDTQDMTVQNREKGTINCITFDILCMADLQ